MGKNVLIMLTFAALSSPALAQQQTNCTTDMWGNVRCTTTGSPTSGGVDYSPLLNQPTAGDSFMKGYENGQRLRAQREAQQREKAAHDARMDQWAAQGEEAERQRQLSRQAGQLVAAGDCAGAEKLALEGGDFALAGAVKSYCTPKQ